MGRRDKIKGKQDKRDGKLLQRALVRGDALELLPLASRATASLEPEVVAKTYAQDVAACVRSKDDARLLLLAAVQAKHPVDLAALSPDEAMGVRWTVISVCLRQRQTEQARAVIDDLAPFLRRHGPGLLAWLDTAVKHGGRIPPAAADCLVELAEPPPTAWCFPDALDTVKDFSSAVLAGSTLMRPAALAQSVKQHLDQLDVAARRDAAKAAMPIARLHAIEAAAALDRDAVRSSLDLLASLCAYHPDPDTLSLGLRLSQFLEPSTSAKDLRCVGRMIDLVVVRPELWPLGLAAFQALSPEPDLRAPTLALAQRIMSNSRSASVWTRAFGWWYDDHGGDYDDDPPVWITDAYAHLVRSGELARWLCTVDGKTRRELVNALNVFEWELFLDLVEALWDGLPSFDHVWLARNVADCLTITEPLPSAQGSKKTAGALLRQVERFISEQDGWVNEEVLEIKQHLEELAPETVVPGALVSMVNDSLDGDPMSLGPRQRAFIERMGERLVPHSQELLHVVLHECDVLQDGERWVDIHLGKDALVSDLAAVAELIWDHTTWVALGVYIRQRIERHASDSVRDLEGLFRLIVDSAHPPKALVEHLARALVAADERGECGDVPSRVLVAARKLLPKPRKKTKAPSQKKSASKKSASKKKASSKTTKKRTTAKKATAKKASAKTTSAKTTSAKTTSAKTTSAKTTSAKKATAKKATAKKATAKKKSSKKADYRQLDLPSLPGEVPGS